MKFSMIVAVEAHNAIGKKGDLPWPKLKGDMRHFVNKTKGKPVVMGRKTWESIPEKYRPLKDRLNIILSRTLPKELENGDILVCRTPLQVLNECEEYQNADNEETEIVIIGGQQIYEIFLPIVDTIYMTHIRKYFTDCDAFFPNVKQNDWNVEQEDSGEEKSIEYKMIKMTRRNRIKLWD